jgi:pimeloyl-ACP methyl ester carboxylesterase
MGIGGGVEIREYTFDTGAVVLNYAEIPSPGASLVLLHGGNARWQAFESILSDLAAAWHIYAPDFRGHGGSGWVRGRYRLQDYTDDSVTFLRHQLREPAYLFGHSLGGMVALLVASQYPDKVRAVAVGDAPLSRQAWRDVLLQGRDRLAAWRDLSGGQKPLDQLVGILKDAPIEVPGRSEPVPMREVVDEDAPVFLWLATNLYQSDPDLLTALLERFEDTAAGYEMDRVLPAIECPVLLLQADPAAGGLMTDAEVAQALPLLARPSHVRLEGVGHVLHNERKEPIVAALRAFFQSSTL